MTNADDEAGFTAIEALFAFTVAALGVAVFYSAVAATARLQVESAEHREATLLARHVLETVDDAALVAETGEQTGALANGRRYELKIRTVPGTVLQQTDRDPMRQIAITVFDRQDRPRLELKTFRAPE